MRRGSSGEGALWLCAGAAAACLAAIVALLVWLGSAGLAAVGERKVVEFER